MNWQFIIAIILGLLALGYVFRILKNQLSIPEVDPKCDDCPVPGLLQGDEKN